MAQHDARFCCKKVGEMRFWRIGIVLGLWCGLAAVPVGSVAQDRCESTGDIVTLARTILEDRDTLTSLRGDNSGQRRPI